MLDTPNKAQIRSVEEAAAGVVAHLRGRAKSPDLGTGKADFPSIGIRYELRPATDTDAIRAGCQGQTIILTLTGNGWPRLSDEQAEHLQGFIADVLKHEVAHWLQWLADPAAFAAAAARRKTFKPDDANTSRAWLDGYYSLPGEQAAHAVQCAAEVRRLCKTLDHEGFTAAAETTEAYRRPSSRLNLDGDDADSAAWLLEMVELAWKIECQWRAEDHPASAPAAHD